MDSKEIRQKFFDFFQSKNHQIVSSAPMVVKNDPTLMFINAGMNQFKDYFLGNETSPHKRIADTQKCLRVSGKHNDLEEVGHDTYHHTMFEMLGNWSFGDYFKKEAIAWSWELLTEVYKIPKENLYVTVFGGDKDDNMPLDTEAYDLWKQHIPVERILEGSKKDNFWEMGETGPCGPCSEIHIDIRSDEEKKKVSGKELVNMDHPLVIEIWNLVFIEFNRMANGSLKMLPQKHVDTGMGFERLSMVLQGTKSNYDTDVFTPLINKIETISGVSYNRDEKTAIAMRVIADHSRAIAFAIADGQLPSNVKAGYVIRRILRRAVRYGYTFLDMKEPFINLLVPVLEAQMADTFPEMTKQKELIIKVIAEEEQSFLRTLEVGIQLLEKVMKQTRKAGDDTVKGDVAFELYDTFGFPLDLTELILRENNLKVDIDGFDKAMAEQKSRSRQASVKETDDWVVIGKQEKSEFVGYDHHESEIKIIRYRKIKVKKEEYYQLVFDKTPFYGESGGQVGDKGFIESNGEKIEIVDTKKENNLTVHIVTVLPTNPEGVFKAVVSGEKRDLSANNHTATHLLHYALRTVLGTHVEQKGSLVAEDILRFDFSHFEKISSNKIREVEMLVNKLIRNNIPLNEQRSISMEKAEEMGAIMLFGEKYGDDVRVIKFADSVELCGGTHVNATGQIGVFKIISEGSIAAGIRRIEAVTAGEAENYINKKLDELTDVYGLFKNSRNVVKSVADVIGETKEMQKELERLNKEKAGSLQQDLKNSAENINGVNFIGVKLASDMKTVKNLAFAMKKDVENLFMIIGSHDKGKANLTIAISENLNSEKGLHAGNLVRELSKEINGGGGGQPHFASAGGKNPEGIQNALDKAKEIISKL
ncbi:MAG: alanine--tRNA ligase [Bacteroidota bacterium]|nr:alanine--tRNA ligase [Bacteroidota bacterium]